MISEPTPFSALTSFPVNAVDRQVIVHNECWSCEQPVTQNVLHEGASRHELHWQCDGCDVSWMAIGWSTLAATS